MYMCTLVLTKHKGFNQRRQAMLWGVICIWREMTKMFYQLCLKIEQLTALAWNL